VRFLETCAALGLLERSQLALRQAGELNPGTRDETGLKDLSACRRWRIGREAPTAQVYEREKNASMTRGLQFCHLASLHGCRSDTVAGHDGRYLSSEP
jgi:hypothetical protein